MKPYRAISVLCGSVFVGALHCGGSVGQSDPAGSGSSTHQSSGSGGSDSGNQGSGGSEDSESGSGGSSYIPRTGACSAQLTTEHVDCGADCPITFDVTVTCDTSSLSPPQVLPHDEIGVQFLFSMGFLREGEAFARVHSLYGTLDAAGSLETRIISTEPVGSQGGQYFIVGMPSPNHLPILGRLHEQIVSISEPYSGGEPDFRVMASMLYNPFSLRAAEVDAIGTTHAWVVRYSANNLMHVWGTASDGFTSQSATWVGSGRPFLDANGTPMILAAQAGEHNTLVALDSSSSQIVDSLPDGHITDVLPAYGIVADLGAPRFVALYRGPEEARVVAAPESNLDAFTVPAPGESDSSCDTHSCNQPCEYVGDYVAPGSIRATRTSDGRVWVAWIHVHEDTTTFYPTETSDDAHICYARHSRDDSWAEVLLHGVDLENGTSTEVLKFPFPGPTPTMVRRNFFPESLHFVAVGSDLILSFAMVPDEDLTQDIYHGDGHFDARSFRALRLDTSLVP